MSSTRSAQIRRRAGSALVALSIAAGVFAAAPSAYAASQLTVDLAVNTGALRYGATGFLYGLGDEGIPNQVMLSTLKPKVTAQKAPDGLQHPNGDALKIAPMWKRVGGGDIQIYMQDVYQQWPYQNLGISDYLAKVDTMARKVVADPYRSSYVYVPFNEPDLIWYSGNVTGLAAHWKQVYDKIRSIDSSARIAGPNFASYRAADMRTFMTLAKNNNALPHVTTWHELGNDFFTSWDAHLADYRDIESDLGIGQRPININEYARSSGDLGVPGNLLQYVARFENSKVDGCLAYWTTAGGLNDLVTQNSRATGGWWLYKWYGELTGNTVAVTPPSASSPLQGLAALDAAKKQARVIFGGNNPASGTYDTNVVVRGFGSASYLGSSVHAMVFGVGTSGLNPSPGQYLVTEGDFTVAGGQITVPLTGLKGTSAYQVIITPNKDTTSASSTTRYEAEYAALSGSAAVTYGSNTGYSGTYFTEGYGASSNASTKFVVNATANGYYNIGLRYSAGPIGSAPAARSIRLRLNGADLATPALPGTTDWNTWNTVTTKVFLTAGINQVEVNAYTGDDADAINVDYLDVTATTGTITAYQAESSVNTRSGAAAVGSNSAASGGQYVGYVGNGAGNTLKFNNVTAPAAGRYRMVVTYANGELGPGATNYNSNIVDRYADVSVNGATARRSYFRNTLGWSNFRTTVVDVDLAAGANTITFANAVAYAPDLDLIQIAASVG
ncbi:carbohydrate-binding protein [Catellatospora methionotrophica]|uniref:carbohydrate-binding protein n=1 Tax=Catellatospora methionotrophica TaxID=121620 RepID=UPI0034074E30